MKFLTLLTFFLFLTSCSQPENKASVSEALTFEPRQIADSLTLFWGHTIADITGDGTADVVFISNCGRGGYLGYFEGKTTTGRWDEVKIADQGPKGRVFAVGDLESADIDFDGDLDIVVAEHDGEWDAAADSSLLVWYENPSWTPHIIGLVPDFIKDISIADFNNDSKMDVAALTFETSSLSVFQQNSADSWERVLFESQYGNLHEGMGVGDVNGDNWIDIIANAHAWINPEGDLSASWTREIVDQRWNSQEGDWSRNGTKTFLKDINDNGKAEVFISHSERSGYPVMIYERGEDGNWTSQVLNDSIPACHTLQVADFDLDGLDDVLTGVNRSRAQGLGYTTFPVEINLSRGNDWEKQVLTTDGIYNGQVLDYDGDGDMDILRYPTHDATRLFIWENQVITSNNP